MESIKKLTEFLSYLGISVEVNNDSSPLLIMSIIVLFMSVLCLLCFINVFGYTLTYVFIQKGLKYENKFPTFLKKIINYYKNATLLFIVLEGILCLVCLILLVYFSLLILYV